MFIRLTHEKVRRDKSGKRWNFCYGYSGQSVPAQRLFFWDDEKTDCGVVIFLPGNTRPYGRITNLIEKLVSDSQLRKKHQRELHFPLENFYSEFPFFPEEIAAQV